MGTAGGSGTRGGGGGVNGGGAETAAVPTHLCAHLTGQTSPWVEHRPSPKNGHSTGVPLAACRHPQVLWVYSSGGLGAGDGAEGQPGLGPVPGGREAPEEVPAGRSDCSGPAPAMGGPEHPALRAETGRSRCDLLESSTQSDEGHHCPPLGDTGPTQGPVSTQTRTSTAAGNDAGEGG